MHTKQCVVCGNEFTPGSNRQKYCLSCTKYAGTAQCKNCGKEFRRKSGTTGQYCSRRCAYDHHTRPDMARRPCPVCGKEFKPTRADQITCSHECSLNRQREVKLRTCPVCGREFDYGKHPEKATCSKACAGELRRKGPMHSFCERCGKRIERKGDRYRRFCSSECRARQVGSKRLSNIGYIMLKVGKSYPGANRAGWILEHRYVIEQSLGRPLGDNEHVHHKNGDRTDNRLENLELWSGKKDPKGQRQIDLVKDSFMALSSDGRTEFLSWLQTLQLEK